jgi:hypothetical protein
MQLHISWAWFCYALGLAAITTIIMSRQAKQFFTLDVVVRNFSILDLEFAAAAKEIVHIIKGIYLLPQPQSTKTIKALKGQLIIDFLFMPGIYGTVFLGCMHVSCKMTTNWGQASFAILAWLQLIPWLCDIIENIYLLNKIKPVVLPSSDSVHVAYQRMELVKWGLSLTGGVCSIAALLFFWVSGKYAPASFPYLLMVIGEVILFFILAKLFVGKPTQN